MHDHLFKTNGSRFDFRFFRSPVVDIEVDGHPVICNFSRHFKYAAKDNSYACAIISNVANRIHK